MNPVLLLTATLLVASLPALAQDKTIASPDSKQTTDPQKIGPSVAEEPWNIFAKPFQLNSQVGPLLVYPDGQVVGDTVCYKIRSYVVARDGKHSDSVHPVGYSTCQPASKYRLRTTEMTTGPARR